MGSEGVSKRPNTGAGPLVRLMSFFIVKDFYVADSEALARFWFAADDT